MTTIMSTYYSNPSPEQTAITPESLQVVQKRSARVAQAVYNLAVASYTGYPEIIESPRAATPVVPASTEAEASVAHAPASDQLSLAHQAVLRALETES